MVSLLQLCNIFTTGTYKKKTALAGGSNTITISLKKGIKAFLSIC